MFHKYDIIEYKNNIVTYRFDNNSNKTITIDLIEFPNYEPCYDYYFKDLNQLEKIPESNGYLTIEKNNIKYHKCYQHQFDKFHKRYPNHSNGLLYRHLETQYKKLFQ